MIEEENDGDGGSSIYIYISRCRDVDMAGTKRQHRRDMTREYKLGIGEGIEGFELTTRQQASIGKAEDSPLPTSRVCRWLIPWEHGDWQDIYMDISWLAMSRRDHPDLGPSLIVVPLSVFNQWFAEIRRFNRSARIYQYHDKLGHGADISVKHSCRQT